MHVRLRADQEALAGELHRRYGDAVDLTVGYLHFPDRVPLGPDGTPQQPFVSSRHSTRAPLLDPAEIEVSTAGALTVRSGHDLLTALKLRNLGPEDVVVRSTGQVLGHVVDPGTDEVIGSYDGPMKMPLVRSRIPRGGSGEIPLLIGTASPVPRLGYATPPGRWAVEVLLALEDRGGVRAPLLPFTVTP